jgi:hypothetical protein
LPPKVDLVLANSSFPYCDPLKIRAVITNIYKNLNLGGHFVGNFFVSKYVRSAKEATKEMGLWLVNDKGTVVYLLAGHGYEVIECDKNGVQQDLYSSVFVCKN